MNESARCMGNETFTLPRLARLVAGLAIFGAGLGLVVRGDHGLPPWDVLHQGIADSTPLTIGTAVMAVGAILVLVMVWLREPIGVGTLANVIVIGLSLDITLWLLDQPSANGARVSMTLAGPLVVAIGSGLYLGTRLGPGPRDGLMTALDRRGVTTWQARLGVESIALIMGLVLGGTVGWGTAWFLIAIGPAVQLSLRWLAPADSGYLATVGWTLP
ncbi:MAG: YczE/YyaS/YitT family protein [Acidimicrobiales bacterium]